MFNATPEPRRTAPVGSALLAALAVAGAGFGEAAIAKPATPRISATAKYQAKAGRVMVKGVLKGLTAGSQVSVYDAADHMLLYAVQANAKSGFSLNLTDGDVPCRLQLESGAVKTIIKVAGAPKSCSLTPTCAISQSDQQIHEGGELTFSTVTKKIKGVEPEFSWDLGDGSSATGASVTHKYNYAGVYKVTLKGSAGDYRCSDDLRVSVAAPAGSNPNGKVPEQGERPAVGAAMPGSDGSNDKDAYVVMPFEDTGMEGGSQVNIPFNPLVPHNAMNAQVIQKVPAKPKLIDGSQVQLFYSAASNPDDPVGSDSINSTSQNIFSGGAVGANFDPDLTTCSTDCTTGSETVLLEGRNYNQAVIRKTELWDHIEQPNSSLRKDKNGAPDTVQRGTSNADNQNRYKPAKPTLRPDEGMRGKVDLGVGVRSMPGISDPYKANDPMPFDYASGQNAFVAQNIPLTDIDDQGRTNPYPLLRVEAKDSTGNRVAATDAVYTTASETGCRACHLKGGIAGADIWRTPVHERELKNADGSPGPATGAGSFPMGSAPTDIQTTGDVKADVLKYGYGPAIHNRFDEDYSLDASMATVGRTTPVLDGVELAKDANGIRTDRVAESRWLKPDGTTSPTNPDNDPTWKLQIRLNFREASHYGEDTWQNREKAAVFNTLLLHDYMVKYNQGFRTLSVFSDLLDDKYYASRPYTHLCSGHHYSQQKPEVGSDILRYPGSYSLYSGTEHAFHGKMQVYAQDVTADQSADKQAHKKGDLIRDERGHPVMLGGRGWDSQHNDDEGVPLSKDADGNFTVKKTSTYDTVRNNWDPQAFPAHPFGASLFPVGPNVSMDDNCLKCHTGRTEQSYRDIHHAAGLKCDSCHGDMLAVGYAYGAEAFDQNLTGGGTFGVDDTHTTTAADFRRPWLDEPDCGSCHTGDGNVGGDAKNGYFSAGALKQAWADGDKAAVSLFPEDARFAVMPFKETRMEKETPVTGTTTWVEREISQSLYRKSGDVHGSGANGLLTCSTCHGGSHSIWPNKDPKANDNVTARQLQGYDGNIAECSVCHVKDDFKDGLVATDGGTTAPFLGVAQGVRANSTAAAVSPANTPTGRAFLAGPHGMHPVGDEYWWKHADGAAANKKPPGKDGLNGGWHNDMATMPGPDGEDQCAACHGSDHKGTRLSKTLKDREFVNEKGKTVKVMAGTVIGCNVCHSLAKSFTGAPDPKAKDGGWPKAQKHAPPKPGAVAGGDGGGGGHNH